MIRSLVFPPPRLLFGVWYLVFLDESEAARVRTIASQIIRQRTAEDDRAGHARLLTDLFDLLTLLNSRAEIEQRISEFFHEKNLIGKIEDGQVPGPCLPCFPVSEASYPQGSSQDRPVQPAHEQSDDGAAIGREADERKGTGRLDTLPAHLEGGAQRIMEVDSEIFMEAATGEHVRQEVNFLISRAQTPPWSVRGQDLMVHCDIRFFRHLRPPPSYIASAFLFLFIH